MLNAIVTLEEKSASRGRHRSIVVVIIVVDVVDVVVVVKRKVKRENGGREEKTKKTGIFVFIRAQEKWGQMTRTRFGGRSATVPNGISRRDT